MKKIVLLIKNKTNRQMDRRMNERMKEGSRAEQQQKKKKNWQEKETNSSMEQLRLLLKLTARLSSMDEVGDGDGDGGGVLGSECAIRMQTWKE